MFCKLPIIKPWNDIDPLFNTKIILYVSYSNLKFEIILSAARKQCRQILDSKRCQNVSGSKAGEVQLNS